MQSVQERGLCSNPAFLRQWACEFRHLVCSLPGLLLPLQELSTCGALNNIWRHQVSNLGSPIEKLPHRKPLNLHVSIYDDWKEGDVVCLSPQALSTLWVHKSLFNTVFSWLGHVWWDPPPDSQGTRPLGHSFWTSSVMYPSISGRSFKHPFSVETEF
jgi:hypothetical protein